MILVPTLALREILGSFLPRRKRLRLSLTLVRFGRTFVTPIVRRAELELSDPPRAWKVMKSAPTKPGVGLYRTVPAASSRLTMSPCAGPAIGDRVSGSPFGSEHGSGT